MKEYEENTKRLYNSIDEVWPNNNAWYNYTKKRIFEFIDAHSTIFSDKSKTLNAGSGGTIYNYNGIFYHIDLAENLICHLPNHFVSSVENMPFKNSEFNIVICVGSVINYCDAFAAINEISRVSKKESYLILEYERSKTGELLFDKKYGKIIVKQQYQYNGQANHLLWLYSDKYINNILNECNYKIIDEQLFHSLSSIYNCFHNDENKAGKYTKFDKYMPYICLYSFSHNRIVLCKKK